VRANKLRGMVAGWKDGKDLPASCPPFPERRKGLWPYVAVAEWGIAAGVTNTGKDKWELKPVPITKSAETQKQFLKLVEETGAEIAGRGGM